MPTFALERLLEIDGPLPFFKLVIDGHCPFDDFCDRIREEGNRTARLMGAFNILSQVANMQRLPAGKFRDITPRKEKVKEYEIKRGDLRIYLIKHEGHLVILGGKKGSQQKDITRFRSIKKMYLNTR